MAKPLQYAVCWTVVKPDAARTITLSQPSLTQALELARDLWARHTRDGDGISVAVTTPAGNTLVDWHADATPF
jgi:hypothetical protein